MTLNSLELDNKSEGVFLFMFLAASVAKINNLRQDEDSNRKYKRLHMAVTGKASELRHVNTWLYICCWSTYKHKGNVNYYPLKNIKVLELILVVALLDQTFIAGL